MDPRPLGPEQWSQIGRALTDLSLFAGLALNAALAFLLGHAVIPSLVAGAVVSPEIRVFRWVLYPVFAASLILTVFALGRGLYVAVEVLRYYYPRFLI
jgi:hypothetical protein